MRSADFVTLQVPSGHFVVAEHGGDAGVRADRHAASAWGRVRIANVTTGAPFVPLPAAAADIQPSSP